MLLIERCVVLRLAHRRSQVLGSGTVQHVEVSRSALQGVAAGPLKGVVVNRANATRVEAAVIHARLAVLADRRSTLHLTAKVRRPLARLLDTTQVLGSPKTPHMSTTGTSTTETASPHVSTADMASPTGASAATDMASSRMPATTSSSTRAARGREVLKAEQ